MFQALFNSLSGLFSFSRSLNTVSNNVSNMNTPGFRGSDSFFANVNDGRGVRITGEGLRTAAGDLRQTGNATDLAIEGTGYFVLRDTAGQLHYTRAGQFQFNEAGLLVDSVTGHQVMAFNDTATLTSIDFDSYRSIPAVASTAVSFSGNIAPGSTTTTINSISVFDKIGTAHVLSATLTRDTTPNAPPGNFRVVLKDETGATIGEGQLRFGTDGTPLAGFNTIDIAPTFAGVAQPLTFKFGTPGTLDGATSLSGLSTTLAAKVDDGHGILNATSATFDDKGVLQLVYSATEKRQGPQIALASFPNESAMRMKGGRLLDNAALDNAEVGRAGEGRFGRIAGGSLELSNVDLTQEFADMIIIQRGYQASSRVMTVSNEMIEQLYNSTRGG